MPGTHRVSGARPSSSCAVASTARPPKAAAARRQRGAAASGQSAWVDVEAVLDRLDVDDVGDVDAVRRGARLEQNRGAAPLGNGPETSVKFLGEGEPWQGLHQVGQRPHLVAVDCELRGRGNEDENNLSVHLADCTSCAHPVHVRHLDVHENDVVHRLVVADNGTAVVEVGEVERDPLLLAVASKVIGQELARSGFVLDDCDANHARSSPMSQLIEARMIECGCSP